MEAVPLYAEFVDDELLRAPLSFDRAIDATLSLWVARHPGGSRLDADPARVLRQHRDALMQAALRALRLAVQTAPDGDAARAGVDPLAGRHAAGLSLIDEAEVSADIEVARCIETVRVLAEAELRDLQTYTSALVGDLRVSRDTNPFRAEVMVRALWRGVQAVPLQRSTQAAFMRDAARPLAQALQQGWRAAAQRLHERGVVPAEHRTIRSIGSFAASTRTGPAPPPDLRSVRDSLPLPWAAVEAAKAAAPARAASQALAAAHAATGTASAAVAATLPTAPADGGLAVAPPPAAKPRPVDPRVEQLLQRLFEQIGVDRGLPAELSGLLRRLQPAAQQLARHDASLLDNFGHPLWRFMDELAHAVTLATAADRLRLLGLAHHLVEQLAADQGRAAALYGWASERLQAMQRHLLAQALGVAAPEVADHRRHARAAAQAEAAGRGEAPSTGPAPLDIATLDTVPAELMDEPPAPSPARAAGPVELAPQLLVARPGDFLRAYLQGDWRLLQLLQADNDPALWLLRDQVTERLWPVRPPAMDRLAAERLARTLRVRSLARRAAERVLRGG